MTQVQGQDARNYGDVPPIHRRKYPISARFRRLHECQASAILGWVAKPDRRELECAIRPLGTDRLAAPLIWAVRAPASADG